MVPAGARYGSANEMLVALTRYATPPYEYDDAILVSPFSYRAKMSGGASQIVSRIRMK